MEVLFGILAFLALLVALRLVFSGGNSLIGSLTPLAVLLAVGVLFLVLSRDFTDTISSLSSAQVIFYMLGGLALTGGMGVVFSRDIVHAALFLIMTLLMTAGVFVVISAEFLGLVQILLYGGAVTILVIFALMITRAREVNLPLNGSQWPIGLLAGIGVGAVLVIVARNTVWPGNQDLVHAIGVDRIGQALFNDYALPFEIASLVLIVALVGAVVIARTEDA